MVELLLSDEDGDGGDYAEEADGGLEGPEAALLNPGNDAAAVGRQKSVNDLRRKGKH